jgi:hypothetical protein
MGTGETVWNLFRQDLQDYLDFCAFPEERHKLIVLQNLNKNI